MLGFFYPRPVLAFRVLSLPACVCVRLSVCVYVRVSYNHALVRTITQQPFKLGSPNWDHRCKRPSLISLLFFLGWMILTFKVKFDFKVKIYPILSLWVCPRDRSPLIEIRIFKFGPIMHLSTVTVPSDLGLDWPWSSVSFSNLCFSTNFCVSYSFASVWIYSVRPSPVNAPHSTRHRTYMDSFMHVDRVPPWFVKPSSFISWWDHRNSMSRQLSDRHWILQAPIGFRQFIQTSHDAILYANIRQS